MFANSRIEEDVRAALRIRSTHIHVKVSHGHLTLTGYAREQAESAAAAEDGASLHGVIEVTNRIEIR
jgi:osmotically-inducible protein OsmY